MNTQEQLNEELIKTIQNGDLDKIKNLVEQGADIHVKDDYALRLSAANGHLYIVKYLVEQGADIHADNDCALRYSANNGRLEVVKYLVEQGADIHADNDCALKWSAKYGHLETVKYFIIDCNITIKQETMKYLHKNNLVDTLNIIQTRDLHNQLDHNLNSKITDTKNKVKI
jgi:ankyrin repeat protein